MFMKKAATIIFLTAYTGLILCSCQPAASASLPSEQQHEIIFTDGAAQGNAKSGGLLQESSNAINLSQDDTCVDGECEIPETDENGNQVYAIVSPVGYNNVDMITQPDRLDTLEGKKIALVGGSFMAAETFAELKKCILRDYPTATVYVLQEVGSGGPFSVFGQSRQTKLFQERLQELKIDAVVSGNCGCGLCTTKESGSSIAAEYIGIPTVTIGAPSFIAQIHSTGVNRGVPVLRTAEYPGAFASQSSEELLENTREVIWPQVVKALTTPITQPEIDLYANDGKRPYDEIIYYGSYEDVQDFYQANGWTDGLPVVPATDEKVREYLRYTPYQASDVLGTYALAYRECQVYTVAVNAVMAGVPREYMPICIAIAQCLEDGEWRRPLASTHGWSPYAWLNGPLARQLGIDHSQGMISEENNKVLGRFIDLSMLNLGGYYVKENRMGTFGYLTPWTFSEDEEACLRVGWEPYHVTQGYDLNSNTVTAGSALEWGNNVTPATNDAEQIMKLLAWDITEKQQNGLGNTNPQVYRTVFITEPVASDMAARYATKASLEDALIETARRPLWMRTYAHYWANTGSQQFDRRTIEQHYQMLLNDSEESAGLTDTPEWLAGFVKDEQIMTIATMLKGQTPLLVTGDSDRNKFQVMPGGGYVTYEIKLPDNWNELTMLLGYEPLESFYLDPASYASKKPSASASAATPAPAKTAAPAYNPSLPASVTPAPAASDKLTVPAALSDGTYRLLSAQSQLTGEGRVYYAKGTLSYWNGNSVSDISLSADSGYGEFAGLLEALTAGCSFSTEKGKVTALTLRPPTTAQKTNADLTGLANVDLSGIKLTVGINSKKSTENGAITPSGTSLLLPAGTDSFSLELDKAKLADSGNTEGFLTFDYGLVTINSASRPGSSAKVTAKSSDGEYQLIIITMNADRSLSVTYKIVEQKPNS